MDLTEKGARRELARCTDRLPRILNKAILIIMKLFLLVVILGCIFGASLGIGLVKGIIDNTPDISVESIVPMGYSTSIYDAAGNLTDTLVMAGSNRQEATYDEIPQDMINAFVAIEDSRFWQHHGIDTRSILRAALGIITGDSSAGGGSTITQQLIKNNVFNGGREKGFGAKLERKLQEQYLAIQLEKTMDKKLIITNYLNTINLGSNTLGVKVAARRYFNKELKDLTLSECTVIAGITQNPSKLNPITGAERNAQKREVILQYMYEQGYITKEQQEEALADDVYSRIENNNTINKETTKVYSYFTDELIDQVMTVLENELGYSNTQAHNLLYSGGLSIYTTQDPELQAIVDDEINDPSNYVKTQYSIEYRLSVKDSDGNTVNYSESNLRRYFSDVLGKSYSKLYDSEEEARQVCDDFKAYILEDGGEVVGESFTATLQPETSFVLIEQSTGYVKAITGGRGTKTASRTLNRASDSHRQPGSTFKVLTAFAPAVDACGATLATVYYDEPYTLGTKSFRNWYSSGYLGWSNIREGIIYSMNIVAVRAMVETVTPELGVEYARKFGITTLTDSDYNAATALGGITDGVSNLELTSAFSVIANGGERNKPVMFTMIKDHDGKVIYRNTIEPERVIKDSTAYLMTDAMAQSMQPNKKYARQGVSVNATSSAAQLDSMSCAGKSGTTTNNYDIWFVGYTPYYTGGIWAGYDNNESTLSGQTSFHKAIWKKIMDRVHSGLTDTGFTRPDSIVEAQICRKSGKLAIDGVCENDPRGSAVYTEYFEDGTVPTEYCDHHILVTVCSDSGQYASDSCPNTTTGVSIKVPGMENIKGYDEKTGSVQVLPKGSSFYSQTADETTDDSVYAYRGLCQQHTTGIVVENNPFSPGGVIIGPGYQETIDDQDNMYGPGTTSGGTASGGPSSSGSSSSPGSSSHSSSSSSGSSGYSSSSSSGSPGGSTVVPSPTSPASSTTGYITPFSPID
jgi:penicillin-binding protein 1A